MADLKARVSYLQGLSAGMELNADTKESKLLNGIIEVLGEFADSFRDLTEAQTELEDYIETLDEDLYRLEDEIYKDNGIGKEDDYIEVDCPRCGEVVCFNPEILEEDELIEVTCPNCDEVVYTNENVFKTADEAELLREHDKKRKAIAGEDRKVEGELGRIAGQRKDRYGAKLERWHRLVGQASGRQDACPTSLPEACEKGPVPETEIKATVGDEDI